MSVYACLSCFHLISFDLWVFCLWGLIWYSPVVVVLFFPEGWSTHQSSVCRCCLGYVVRLRSVCLSILQLYNLLTVNFCLFSRLSAVYLSAFKLQHSALFVYVSITLLVEGQPPPAARRLAAEGKTSRVNSAYVNAYVNLIFVPNLLRVNFFLSVYLGVATVYVIPCLCISELAVLCRTLSVYVSRLVLLHCLCVVLNFNFV